MVYPVTLPAYTTKTNKAGVVEDGSTSKVYASHINDLQDVVVALATKVGIDSSADTSSLDYKVADVRQDATDLEAEVNTAQADIVTLQTTSSTLVSTVATHLTPANAILPPGLDAAKPAAGTAGRIYIATDTGAHYRDSGAAWVLIHPVSGAGLAPSTIAGAYGYDSTQRRWRAWDGVQLGDFGRVLAVPDPNSTDTLSAATINTTETAFSSTFAIPANYLIPRKLLRVSALFSLTTSAVPVTIVLTLRVQKSGPTDVNLWRNLAITPPINLTSAGYGFEWIFSAKDAVGAAAGLETGSVLSALFGQAVYNTIAQRPAADTTAAQTIQVTVTYSGNTAGNSISLRHGLIVEELR